MIHLAKKRPKDALTIPRECFVSGIGGSYVYVVRDGKAHRVRVWVNYKSHDAAEITKGPQAGDLVVTKPKDLEGQVVPVKIKREP